MPEAEKDMTRRKVMFRGNFEYFLLPPRLIPPWKALSWLSIKFSGIGVADLGCSVEALPQKQYVLMLGYIFPKMYIGPSACCTITTMSDSVKCMKQIMGEYRSLWADHNGSCFNSVWRLHVCITLLWLLRMSQHLSWPKRTRDTSMSRIRDYDAIFWSMTDKCSVPGSNVKIYKDRPNWKGSDELFGRQI